MSANEPGFYLDPYNPEIYRQWDGERWTVLTRTGPDAEPVARNASHVGRPVAPPDGFAPTSSHKPGVQNATPQITSDSRSPNNSSLIVAIVWCVLAVIVGLVFILGTTDEAYGGDAYTGIQHAGAQTVRALGWLIFATGPLGLIVALSPRR